MVFEDTKLRIPIVNYHGIIWNLCCKFNTPIKLVNISLINYFVDAIVKEFGQDT
jgi:hypothetical protein